MESTPGASPRRWLQRASVVAAMLVACAGRQPGAAASRFDRAPWHRDLAHLERVLERSYGHLLWQASPESSVDLPALHRRATREIAAAENESEARAAIGAFVRGFRDGHFAPVDPVEPATGPSASPSPPPRSPDADAVSACAALGYAVATRTAFSLPFESLDGFVLHADGLAHPFRAGVIVASGRRIGLVRIPRFRAAEFPALCEEAWAELRARGAAITGESVHEAADALWLRTLAARLGRFRREGVELVIVDVGGNGGGDDLGDWAARVFTSRPVRSAPVSMPIGPLAVRFLDKHLRDMTAALGGSSGAARDALDRSITAYRALRDEAERAPADVSWVWRERRPRDERGHSLRVGYMSGPLDYLAPDSFAPSVARELYWATAADQARGAWDGPVYVLTDRGTASAAEMFVALVRDRGVARTVGQQTGGLGCGWMTESPPTVLPHSRLSYRIPNCARLRADGTDDVAGIAPDLPVLATEGEAPRSRALRLLETVSRDARTPPRATE